MIAKPPPLALLPIGSLFHGRYLITRGLGAGAMGAVHEVRDQNTNHRCALKVMLPGVVENEDLRARFALEARITGDIVSDHIVRVLDAGFDSPTGMPFLVMELLHGEELGRLLKQRGRIPAEEVVLYLSQASLALDKTHAAGIVHRDLKPGNLFVTRRDDGTPCIKILDFGIAKVLAGSSHAHTTRAIGTPLYMAPEQVLGKGAIGPATDIYALGHIAYALLAGEPYWFEESRTMEMFPFMQCVLAGASEPPSVRAQRRGNIDIPKSFDAWFLRATAQAAADRFDRASQAALALREALVPPPLPAPAPSNPFLSSSLSSASAATPVQEAKATPVSQAEDASSMAKTMPLSALPAAKALQSAHEQTSPPQSASTHPPTNPPTILPGSTSFSVTSGVLPQQKRPVRALMGVAIVAVCGVGLALWVMRAPTNATNAEGSPSSPALASSSVAADSAPTSSPPRTPPPDEAIAAPAAMEVVVESAPPATGAPAAPRPPPTPLAAPSPVLTTTAPKQKPTAPAEPTPEVAPAAKPTATARPIPTSVD